MVKTRKSITIIKTINNGFSSVYKFALALSLFLLGNAFLQASKETQPPIDNSWLTGQWTAWWITHPEASLYNYEVLNFRKAVELESVPEHCWVHVSGDNRYELYVNGTFVCHGPARGDLLNWHYETVDIAPHLVPGENIVSAMVWNAGEHKPMAQISDKTAFLLQGNDPASEAFNTDESWLVYKNQAYSPVVYRDNDVRLRYQYYVAGVLDSFDASKMPWGWKELAFDDDHWSTPRQLDRPYPRGQHYHHKWQMTPRQIPLLLREPFLLDTIVRTRPESAGIRSEAGLPLEIPPNEKVEILFDVGQLAHGYPELTVSGGKESSIQIRYAEAFLLPGIVKKHRDEPQETLFGIHDAFFPDGGAERKFRPLWTRTFRWLQLEIETGADALTVDGLRYENVHYPSEILAGFETDSEMLNKIWAASVQTQILSAQETYVSDLYWEQIQYVADTLVQALVHLWLTGDDRLFKLALKQFDDSRLPNGLVQSRYPCNLIQMGRSFSLMWIHMLHKYWMYGEDPDYVKQFLPGMGQVLGWHERNLTDGGMLRLEGFVDWGFRDREKELRREDRNTESTVHTLLYAYTLKKAEELYKAAGEYWQASECKKMRETLLETVQKRSWDEDRQLYTDVPGRNDLFSQHTNIMAVLSEIVGTAQRRAFLERMLADEELLEVDMFFQFFLGRALKQVGLGNSYLSTIESWEYAVNMGMTTFGEAMTEPRSECHAWSTSPAFEFLSTVCGIDSTAPGFGAIEIRPNLNGLGRIKGSLKHPKGQISVELEQKGNSVIGSVMIPKGVPAIFAMGDQEFPLKDGKNAIDVAL